MQNVLCRALAGLAMLVSCSAVALADTPAGKVVAIAGDCSVEAGGKATALKLGTAVNVEDTVTVADAAKLKIRLNDGSVISLGSGTRTAVSDLALDGAGKRDRAEVSLGQGLLRALVTPVAHPTTFEVKTATGTAAVRSTDWFVQATPGLTEVAVLSGSVTLRSNSTGVGVTIPALYTASVAEGHDPTDPRPMKAADFNPLIAAVEIAPAPVRPTPAPRRRQPQSQPDSNSEPDRSQQAPEYNGQPPGAYEGPPAPPYDGPPPSYGGPGYGGPGYGGPGYGGPGYGGFGFGFGGRGGGYSGGQGGGRTGGSTDGTTRSPSHGR